MQKFRKGELVNFVRSAGFKINNTPIIAVVPIPKTLDGKEVTQAPIYIIESNNGWIPNITRKMSYELDEQKKYIFVNQDELTAA